MIHHITPFYNDLYQFTMAYGYFKSNKHNVPAVFQCIFRKCPFKGQYAICAGIRQLKQFLQNFKFAKQDISFLRQRFPHMQQEFFEWMINLNAKDVIIQAIQEGQLVFPHQPVVIIKGPLALVQMMESPVLNMLGFAILVATNASRISLLVPDKICFQFGLRRAQGPDGALSASEYSYLGGFNGTSNTQIAKRLNIKCFGTMAHSFITSFNSLQQVDQFQINGINIKKRSIEIRKQKQFHNTNQGQLAAFITFAKCFPQTLVCLVDTYDTLLSGMKNFICVALAMLQAKKDPIGIRLDSGNLGQLSMQNRLTRKCKELFKEHSHYKIKVMASNDLNQQKIFNMTKNGHQIDNFGIGTHIATCQKQPALGLVYKLVSLDGIPKMKISQQPQKAIYPCIKNIHRIYTKQSNGLPFMDIISQQGQQLQLNQKLQVINKSNHNQMLQIIPIKILKLNQKIWDSKQQCVLLDIHQAREYCLRVKEQFNQHVLRYQDAQKYKVYLTGRFFKKYQLILKQHKIKT